MRIIIISILAFAGIASLVFTKDLKQKNPETIFLTSRSLKEYDLFKKDIVEKNSLVIMSKSKNKELFYKKLNEIETSCIDDCEILTSKKLSRSNSHSLSMEDDLMKLESSDYVSAIVLDNTDLNLKKILTNMEKDQYWSNGDMISFAGLPYTNYLLDKYSLSIQESLFPMMFGLGFILSIIFVGNLKNAVIVYLPCLFSAGFSLATIKILYGTMNMVTSIIPLVVFTVALSLSFHLFFSLVEFKNLKVVFKYKWAPIFLMMFTTYIGFLSLGWSEILVIRQFGIVSAQLVLLTTLYLFAWYGLFSAGILTFKNDSEGLEKTKLFPTKLFKLTLKNWIIIFLAIAGVTSIIWVPSKLKIITDATLYFPQKTKIREKILEVTHAVSGMPIMEIVVSLKEDLNQKSIEEMRVIEESIVNLPLGQKYKIVSNNNLVKKVNSEYTGEKTLPQSLESYLALRGQIPSSLQESYPVEKSYRMTLLGNPLNSHEYSEDLAALTNLLQKKSIKFRVNGIYYNLMESQKEMIQVLKESFISSAIVIFLFSAFFLRRLDNTLIFIFVSLLPVCLTFGIMYFLGYSINIATVMTFSISLGMVGDSSFHIIYAKYNKFNSFEEYKRGILVPVIGSGLLLCVCFGIFTFNPFMPIREFGGILAIIMLLGTLVDLYVLPTLLYRSHNHQKAYENNL